MPLSEATLRRCVTLARGRCECEREGHGHQGRCLEPLTWDRRGQLAPGGWYAVPWTSLEAGGADEAENAEALCWRCYEKVMEQAGEGPGR